MCLQKTCPSPEYNISSPPSVNIPSDSQRVDYTPLSSPHTDTDHTLLTDLPPHSFVDIDTIMHVCTAVFDTFQPLSCDVLASIIHKLNRTTCGLDPFPTKLMMSHLSSIINIILRIVNLCFSSGDFPASCKSASFPL